MEKFEIMQSIQNIIDNSNENKSIDKLIKLRNQIHNANRLESKFGPNAYMIRNLRNKKLWNEMWYFDHNGYFCTRETVCSSFKPRKVA